MQIQPNLPQANPQATRQAAPAASAAAGAAVAGASAAAPVRGAAAVSGPSAAADGPPPASPDAVTARLDAWGAGIQQRLGEALAGLAPEERAGAGEGLRRFEQSLGRIRAGIQDGSLSGSGLADAVRGSLQTVAADLAPAGRDSAGADAGAQQAAAAAAAAAPSGTGQSAAAQGAISQGRFQNIVGGIGQRLAGLAGQQTSRLEAAGVRAAQEAFSAEASRIETAFFEGGNFDRSTFYGLVSASLGRLQQRVGDLLPGSARQDASLYSAKQGVDSLGASLRKVSFDRTA